MGKKIIITFALLQLCMCICGCKTSFIEDSKKSDVDINSYFSELEPTKSVASSAYINDIFFSNEDESKIQEKLDTYDLYEGVNSLHIKTSFDIDYSVLGWNKNITVRFFLFNKGELVPFALEDSDEYNIYNDFDYVIYEELDVALKFKSEDVLAESGTLTVMAYFNPEAEAGRGVQSYAGSITRSVKFTNEYYDGTEANAVSEYDGEYIEIPSANVRNAQVACIGDNNLYDSEFVVKNYEGDVVVPNSSDDLYIYWNEGPGSHKPDSVMLGVFVDGTLCKISGEDYFIRVQQNNGKWTFKYSLGFLEELDSGLHSVSIICLRDDGTERFTKRFAVIIP